MRAASRARPVQACHEWNTAVHVADYEGRPERRSLAELQALFDAADDRAQSAVSSRRKGWLSGFRDATLFQDGLRLGLRQWEAVMPDVCDFTANPVAPELCEFGVCQVRHGKAMRGARPSVGWWAR
jgi:integrase/recombinase XerC